MKKTSRKPAHDPESPLMTGALKPTDLILPLRQESFLDKEPRLF
ncbi:hypothetical protein [Prevotella sp. oral taxon 376]|nr:hypothetical protein [Prevotella sp. oral taxon 376]